MDGPSWRIHDKLVMGLSLYEYGFSMRSKRMNISVGFRGKGGEWHTVFRSIEAATRAILSRQWKGAACPRD